MTKMMPFISLILLTLLVLFMVYQYRAYQHRPPEFRPLIDVEARLAEQEWFFGERGCQYDIDGNWSFRATSTSLYLRYDCPKKVKPVESQITEKRQYFQELNGEILRHNALEEQKTGIKSPY